MLTDDERVLIKSAIALDMEGPPRYREGADWIAWYLTNERPRRLPQAVERIVAERVRQALREAADATIECPCSDECRVQRNRFLSNQREWLHARADQYDRTEA